MNYKPKEGAMRIAILKQATTLQELATNASVSPVSLSRIYNGGVCRAKTANKIAKALNVPVIDLFE